jgi:hypothetical protein
MWDTVSESGRVKIYAVQQENNTHEPKNTIHGTMFIKHFHQKIPKGHSALITSPIHTHATFLQPFQQSSEGIQVSKIFPNNTNCVEKLGQVFLLPKAVVIT